MYRYRYINKHIQFDCINYTLVLEDLEANPIKTVRIEKSFNIETEALDSDYLYQEARKEIIRINQEESNDPIIAEKDLLVDELPIDEEI